MQPDDDTVIRAASARPPATGDTDDTVLREALPGIHDLDDTVVGATGFGASTPVAGPPPPAACYAFVLGDAEPVLLDRPCIVGRLPSQPRIQDRAPHRLVRVHSARGEVSSSHLELRQVGSTVVATDLRTTNGTVVRLPGSVPRALLQGESVVVTPGTVVDIGDGNALSILPMQRAGRLT